MPHPASLATNSLQNHLQALRLHAQHPHWKVSALSGQHCATTSSRATLSGPRSLSETDSCTTPRLCTNFGERAFFFSGPALWNYLPEEYAPSLTQAFLADVNLRSRLLYAMGRPSVCRLSVTLVRPTQLVDVFSNFFSPYARTGTLVFWCQNSLVGDAPFPLKFAFKVTHPLSNSAISANIGS